MRARTQNTHTRTHKNDMEDDILADFKAMLF